MGRKLLACVFFVVLFSHSALAAEDTRPGPRVRDRERDRVPVIVKVIRFVKGIRGIGSESHLAGDPIP
jgi:hypothetical protein